MTKALSDEDLISICRKEEQTAQNWQDAELQGVRQKAFDYYDRNKVGDFTSEEGESSVVTSEVADTVESVMPGLMRVFASGEQIAEFTPMEEADEQWAKEATQYVPHVLMRENNGFRIIYWFCKDVLLYRVATLTVDVEEVLKTRKDVVQGWTEEQMAMAQEIATEQGATEVEFDVEEDDQPTMTASPTMEQQGPTDLGGFTPTKTFSGTITVTRKKKRVAADNVAPEDLLVSPSNIRDIDEASFAGYRKEVTSSALRLLGLDQETIDSLSAYRATSPEEDQRQEGLPEGQYRKDDQRRLWLVVAYVKVDSDGDGISEVERVVYAHAGGQNGAIIDRREWEEEEAPITIGSAILMPHTIVGRSLFDQTQDLQEVGTAVTRAMLDNTYQVIRPRPLINSRVSILSVLDHTAGMPVQIDGAGNPAENISYVQVPSIIEPALSVMGYLENKRDQRTGTSRMGNNMDSDALSDASRMTMGGTQMVLSAAQERQGLMADTIAQTALSRFYRHIYRAIKRAAEGQGEIKYFSNDEWQTCHPEMWPDDMHLIVNVGTSNKMEEQQNLVGIGAAQEKIIAAQGGVNGPVVTLEHVANTGRKLAVAGGYRATSQFFASDKDVRQSLAMQAQQPPKPDPEMAKVMQKAQADQAKLQTDAQLAQQKQQHDAILAQQQMAADLQQKREAAALEMQLSREKAAQDLAAMREKAALELQLKREAMAADFQLKREEIAMEAELEKYKIDNMPKPGPTGLKQQEVTQ